MNQQWPQERQGESSEAFPDRLIKTFKDFLNHFDRNPHAQSQTFAQLASCIVNESDDISKLEQRVASVAEELEQPNLDSHLSLTSLVCAAALAHSPSLKTWQKIGDFKYNSSEIEHGLNDAMIAYYEVYPTATAAYTKLAKAAFVELNNFSLQSRSTHTNEERRDAWASWNKRHDKIEEIWWNLHDWQCSAAYQEERPLFQVFYKLEPEEFISTISDSNNPYLVSAMLEFASVGGFSPKFSEWQRMISSAPNAFKNDGEWNGSVLLPLLLVEARNQLLDARSNLRACDTTIDNADEIEQSVSKMAEIVAAELAKRRDAVGVFSRWTSWLIRQILGLSENEFKDVKCSAFYDCALIEAIGKSLGNLQLPLSAPKDVQSWEVWCYRCALSSFAHSGHIDVPNWESFLNEWRLSPEDWTGEKGQLLREHASIIINLNREIPGVAANLLAYPIAKSNSAVRDWNHMWDDAITLREIVEFGDSESLDDDYSSRSDAGRLLLLLFNIGLGIFDQCATLTSDNNSAKARSLSCLFQYLYSAAKEMLEIDRTLNLDQWLVIVQHLSIRRMIWESKSDEKGIRPFQVFKADDKPTVSDILNDASGDVFEVAAILQSLLLNDLDSRLQEILDSARLDISAIVRAIRSLNKYHSRKYPVDQAQLERLEALA